MVRATTPTHTFVLPLSVDDVKTLLLTYSQNDNVVMEKEKDDLTATDDNTIQYVLTQEETLKFDASKSVQIQLRVLTHGGSALASRVFSVPCGNVLNPEVLK